MELNRQAEQIEELQRQLNAKDAERKDEQVAAQILRQWIAEGRVSQDNQGNVAIIGQDAGQQNQ